MIKSNKQTETYNTTSNAQQMKRKEVFHSPQTNRNAQRSLILIPRIFGNQAGKHQSSSNRKFQEKQSHK